MTMAALLATPGSWLYLPVAFALGALHALEPGHAKGLMAGFIVANRGSAAQAALLGAAAALSHSLTVWLLVAIGLALGEALPLERFHPWLELAGSVGMAVMLAVMARRWLATRAGGGREHAHRHGHAHDHDHSARRRALGTAAIAWYGLTAGLNPCPGAVVVLLLCLKTGSFGLGVATVAAFSLGLGAVLIAVGVAAAWGSRRLLARRPGDAALAARIEFAAMALVGLMTILAFAHVATHFA